MDGVWILDTHVSCRPDFCLAIAHSWPDCVTVPSPPFHADFLTAVSRSGGADFTPSAGRGRVTACAAFHRDPADSGRPRPTLATRRPCGVVTGRQPELPQPTDTPEHFTVYGAGTQADGSET